MANTVAGEIIKFFASEGAKAFVRPWLARSYQNMGLVPRPPGGELQERIEGIERRLDSIQGHLDYERLAKLAAGIALLRKAAQSRAKEPLLHMALGRLHEVAELPSTGTTGGRRNMELKALAHLGLAQCHDQLSDHEPVIAEHLAWVLALDPQVAEEAFGRDSFPPRLRELLKAQRDASLRLAPGTVFRDIEESWCPEMVVIPAGEFLMGSTSEERVQAVRNGAKEESVATEVPQHRVTITEPFALGRYTVTVGEFARFVEETGHDMSGGGWVWTGKECKHDPARSWRSPGFEQTDRHPVVCVSWNDAKAYIRWLSKTASQPYRLPSEAEWEYACRAGTTTPFWTGATISTEQANYNGNYTYGNGRKGVYRQKTVAVDAAGFPANLWGLHHVHGNVWEWCEDVWHDSYQGAPANGSAWMKDFPPRRHIMRGGCRYQIPACLRSAYRSWTKPDFRYSNLGVRVARTLTP